MFNFFKKTPPKELNKIQGKIERIGVTPDSEFTLTYVIKLKNIPQVFTCEMYRSSPKRNEMALSKENDYIYLTYDDNYNIPKTGFKNLSFEIKY